MTASLLSSVDVIIYFCCRGEYSLFLCLMVHRRHHVRTPYRMA